MKGPIIGIALGMALMAAPGWIHAEALHVETLHVHAQLQLPWDQPPPEFKEMERQGFHQGVQAAADDYDHHRSPEPERRKEFRHPHHVKRSFQDDYRKGFRRGYEDAYKHLMKSNGRHS